MTTAVQYPLRDLIDLQSHPYPTSHPLSPTSSPVQRDNSLERWRESDGDEDRNTATSSAADKGKGKAVEAEGLPKRQSKMSERSKRAVASESWDDDFLFQHDPPAPSSRPPSRSPSRPTTPAHRSTSSTSHIPLSHLPTPLPRLMSSPKCLVLNGPATLSLDSLASSVGWSSDQDPTVTVPPNSTQVAIPRPPCRPTHQAHRKSESTATARPPISGQTTPKSRIPKLSPSTTGSHPAPPGDNDFRSDTPSLTEDSFNSFTTGEEPVTETEDEQTDVAVASPRLRQAPSIERVPSTRKWRFNRGGKAQSSQAEVPTSTFIGFLGRRSSVAPRETEVMIIDRQELARTRQYSPRNALPRPQQSTDSATPRQSRATAATRVKHSSSASTATVSSEGSMSNDRVRRTSTQFAPLSFIRRGSVADAQSPSAISTTFSWREYSGTTTEDDDNGRTTGPDTSELSDDDVLPAGRASSRHVSRPSAGGTPSTSYISPSTRPVSHGESILGGDKTRWNASQVPFASTVSAFALRRDVSSRHGEGQDADATAGRKRKLVKKRPTSTAVGEQESLTASSLGLSNDGTSERPLLAPSIFSTSSGGSSYPDSNRTVLTRSRSTRPMPTLPFAQESGGEGGNRGTTRPATRHRSVTSPTRSTSIATVSPRKGEKGQVVEVDREWLGVVPFPPSPRASLASLDTTPAGPSLPNSASRSSLRPTSGFLRKMSGKSHPPVTGRTQAEAKQTKRGSGIGSSITNLLSRSTSALPLTGKRAPSPAPSSNTVKSSKSLLLRKSSKKGKDAEPQVPQPPSLSALRPRKSVTAPVTSKTPSMSSLPASPPPPPLPRSGSTFSFITRARGFSRSSPPSEAPPSPGKPSTPVDTPLVPPVPPQRPARPPSAAKPSQSAARGQLNAAYPMPSTGSARTTIPSACRLAPTTAPRAARLTAAPSDRPAASKPPRTRPFQAGHRASVSLSSIMPLRSMSPLPHTPQPPVGTSASHQSFASDNPSIAGESDRPPTVYSFGDDLVNGDGVGVPRRNSLSDLRIPARITNAQKKIEEDLERVKQFATAIEELKALRRQYEELVVAIPPVSTQHLSPDQPSKTAVAKTAQAIRRVELDYASWWEQAQTLIDLGDGKPRQDATRPSPGTLASRRDRCVSLVPETTNRRRSQATSESEVETVASARPRDATTIETDASVAHRQREMLRGVLAAPHKGASLPSRAPPAPRPPLTVITQPDSASLSVSQPSCRRVSPLFAALASPSAPSFSSEKPSSAAPSPASRRVSRAGVFGIREFLLRLRTRATEELAASVQAEPSLVSADHAVADLAPVPSRRSVSDPTYRMRNLSRLPPGVSIAPTTKHVPRTASNSTSDSDEDWDLEFSPPRPTPVHQLDAENTTTSLSRRHGRTSSVVGVSGRTATADAKLVLTTEAMPSLLEKVREVRGACETCIGLLKGLTV